MSRTRKIRDQVFDRTGISLKSKQLAALIKEFNRYEVPISDRITLLSEGVEIAEFSQFTLNKIIMNKEARDNAAETLRQALKEKTDLRDEIEGKLADASLELNYWKGSSEEGRKIQAFIETKEEELGLLEEEAQGLRDQLYSITTI